MLSLTDFLEKQILVIFAEEIKSNHVRFGNDNIIFEKDGEIINQLSCYKVLSLFIIGDFTLTTPLIKKCRKFGISISLLGNNFECYASILCKSDANYLLRQKQYSSTNDFINAKSLVKNKIYNQSAMAKDYGKDLGLIEPVFDKINNCENEKELLGIEGSISKQYFENMFKELSWYKRMPRTKVDELNVLLDLGYTFLFNFIGSLLSLYGFDLYRGFYHKLYFQRKSLACDIMEPFRVLIDKQIIKSFNLNQFALKDFRHENGRYYLPFDKQRKYVQVFLECLIDREEDIFQYVKEYYRHVAKNTEFPEFKIK